MRVHELAKEFKITSKDLLKSLADLGVTAKSAQSSIEEETIKVVRGLFKKAAPGAAAKAETKPEPVAEVKPAAAPIAPPAAEPEAAPAKPERPIITVSGRSITTKELSEKLNVKLKDVDVIEASKQIDLKFVNWKKDRVNLKETT